jgi:hypothetical protein
MIIMKPTPTLVGMLTIATIILMVTFSVQQVSAPRSCGSCVEFKKLTHEFEKDVIDAATIGDPGIIPGLLQQYNDQVSRLFTGPE